MNLLFYSGGVAPLNEYLDAKLLALIGRKGRITFIPSSTEGCGPYVRMFKAEKARRGLRRIDLFSVDRPFTQKALRRALASDAIFLSGGNTFYFLKHLRQLGMLEKLRSFVQTGRVLFGLSAGSIIMTPTIRIAGLVPGESDPNEVKLRDLSSLELVRFEVFPHYARSKQSIAFLRKYSKQLGDPIYAFPDGSGVVVEGETVSFHGDVTCFSAGGSFAVNSSI